MNAVSRYSGPMTALVEQAITLSALVHQNQVDKAGVSYVGHPLRVTQLTESHPDFQSLSASDQEVALCVALLHDVVEDSPDQPGGPVTAKDLVDQGFPHEVAHGVTLLTRDSSEADPNLYYRRIRVDQIARMVKLADIADNRNRSRQRLLLSQGIEPNEAKYVHAMEELELTEDEKIWMDLAIEIDVVANDR